MNDYPVFPIKEYLAVGNAAQTWDRARARSLYEEFMKLKRDRIGYLLPHVGLASRASLEQVDLCAVEAAVETLLADAVEHGLARRLAENLEVDTSKGSVRIGSAGDALLTPSGRSLGLDMSILTCDLAVLRTRGVYSWRLFETRSKSAVGKNLPVLWKDSEISMFVPLVSGIGYAQAIIAHPEKSKHKYWSELLAHLVGSL